jgi:glycosyltransferase involved in cell wall biosynthesis
MRVMYLSSTGELGGAERSLLEVVASIRAARPSWPLHVVAATDGPLVSRASELGASVTVLPFGPSLAALGEAGADGDVWGPAALGWRLARASAATCTYLARLRRIVRLFRPDVVHTNSLKMHVLGSWACGAAAVVWHLHDYVSPRPHTARLLRASLTRCAAIVAPSQSVEDDARSAFDGRRVTTVYNAVDLRRFCATGSQLDLDALARLPPASPGIVRVGLLATFAKWKGHTAFLDAIARLPPDLHVRAYIIGGAVYQTRFSQITRDELERRAASLALSGRVGFTGFVESPEDALRSLDIVVHASTAPEPFGLVIAEAMACGRAVIASDAGGAHEVFTPGVDALGHAPGDVDGLATCIAALARDPAARARIGRAGRATAERCFDRSRLAADLVPLYEAAAS